MVTVVSSMNENEQLVTASAIQIVLAKSGTEISDADAQSLSDFIRKVGGVAEAQQALAHYLCYRPN